MQDGALNRHPLGETLVANELGALASFGDRRFQGESGLPRQRRSQFFQRCGRQPFGIGLRKKFLPALLACIQFRCEFAFPLDKIGKTLVVAADDQLALD